MGGAGLAEEGELGSAVAMTVFTTGTVILEQGLIGPIGMGLLRAWGLLWVIFPMDVLQSLLMVLPIIIMAGISSALIQTAM